MKINRKMLGISIIAFLVWGIVGYLIYNYFPVFLLILIGIMMWDIVKWFISEIWNYFHKEKVEDKVVDDGNPCRRCSLERCIGDCDEYYDWKDKQNEDMSYMHK